MNRKMDPRYLLSFIVVWSIVGFPLLSGLTTTFELNNTTYSIVMRGSVVLGAVFLVFNHSWSPNRLALCLFLAFWAAYFLRVYISQFVLGQQTSFPPQMYWIWGFGVSFIPSLAVLARFDSNWAESLRTALVYTALIATILVLLVGVTSLIMDTGALIDRNRWRFNSLNPISMGHLGVSTFLLGLSMLRTGVIHRRERLVLFLALSTGAVLIIYANSRGPLLALAAAVGVMLAGGIGHRRTWWILLVLVFFIAILANLFSDALFSIGGVVDRWTSVASGDGPSAGSRVISFTGAWAQFIQAPIFGNALEEQITQYYPHNLVLESFMATGFIGGVPFVALIVYATYAALKIVRHGRRHLWIGLLAVQYIVASQVSGSIVTSNAMWIMIALATAYYANSRLLPTLQSIASRPTYSARA